MISKEDAYCWGVESSRLVERSTTSAQFEGSLVFLDTVDRINILARVIETTSHGKDLLEIMTLLDKKWILGAQEFDWKLLIPAELRSMTKKFKQTPSGCLAFF